jgi:hypothetical protein
MRFEKNNPYMNRAGRPSGSKNRLAARVYDDVFRLWSEPAAEGSNLTRGEAALITLAHEKPAEFIKVVFSIVPRDRDPVIENVASTLDDDELRHVISIYREQLAARQEQPQLAEVKTITDGRAN